MGMPVWTTQAPCLEDPFPLLGLMHCGQCLGILTVFTRGSSSLPLALGPADYLASPGVARMHPTWSCWVPPAFKLSARPLRAECM